MILDVTRKVFGVKEVSSKSRSWWSSRLSRLRQKSRKLHRIYRRTRLDSDKDKWKDKFKEYKSEILKQKEIDVTNLCENLSTDNLKKLYAKYKRYTQNKIITMPSLINDESNDTAHTIMDKAELYANHVANKIQLQQNKSVHEITVENYVNEATIHKENELNNDFDMEIEDIDQNNIEQTSKFYMNDTITMEELEEAIRKVSTWKAMGPDMVHNYMLKYYGKYMKETLLYLIKWCYTIGYFPKLSKKGNITPIPKEGRN